MKKRWMEPSVAVEEFVANEYVAACWGVACSVGEANEYELSINNAYYDYDDKGNKILKGQTHDSSHCGFSGNQVIYDKDNDGKADSMVEVGTDGLGTLSCTIEGGISNVKVGDYIYWTTSSGNRTWHHQGTVTATVPGHPNRS